MVHLQRPVIITGMHRSGTSLAARLLKRAGVFIGTKLLGPGRGNPFGHFEDTDFLNFQSSLLRRSNHSEFVQGRYEEPEWTQEETEAALALLRARSHLTLWGWKDPRSTLLLGAWTTLLPQAHFVFVYRSPVEVTLSLLKRGTESEVLASPLLGLRSWQIYNERILEFYRQRPRHHFLCNVHSIAGDPDRFVEALGDKLGISLQRKGLRELVDPQVLIRISKRFGVSALVEEVWPEAADIYRQLEECADVAEGKAVPEARVPDQDLLNPLLEVVKVLRSRPTPVEAIQLATLSLLRVFFAPEAVDCEDRLLETLSTLEGRISDLECHTGNLETRLRELTLHATNLEREVAVRDQRIERLERLGGQLRKAD